VFREKKSAETWCEDTETGKMKRVYALKPFDSVANCCSFVSSSGRKLSKMKLDDCSIRIVIHLVCYLLMGLNTALSRGCGVCVMAVGRREISMPFFPK